MEADDVELNLSDLSIEGLYHIAIEHQPTAAVLDFYRSDIFFDANIRYNLLYLRDGINPDSTIEEIGSKINVVSAGAAGGGFVLAYWKEFKNEFRILLCTKDKKYASMRKNLSQTGDKTQLMIVSAVSAAVGASFGAVAGSLIPLCAICLIAVLKMGKEAFCQAELWDVKIGPE